MEVAGWVGLGVFLVVWLYAGFRVGAKRKQ